MASQHSAEVARRATEIYESRLRRKLEETHLHRFVAVEPDSGEHFLGDTLSDGIQSARNAHPDRISFALRVGHPAAVSLGVMST